MMMAYDSSPTPPSGLAEETIERVRSAIVRYLDSPDEAGPELRAALHGMAAEARERSILPEHLLVVLKDIWYGLTFRRLDPMTEPVMLQRIVTMCIKEYYA